MNHSIRYFASFLVISLAIWATPASSNDTSPGGISRRQIVVLVHVTSKGLQFALQSGIHKGTDYNSHDANYFLADLKLHEGADCQIIEVVDDRAPLSAITEVSEIAINAGFKDIRPFVYWHKTGRMAQVQFGLPIEFTMSAEKIEQRVEKAQ
jgi:hypothetical protein